jgi:hypothetical protein
MDIQECAEKYAKDQTPVQLAGVQMPYRESFQLMLLLRDAYLAGSAQKQADCCSRCECSCGAR